jgi:hypothetical protein
MVREVEVVRDGELQRSRIDYETLTNTTSIHYSTSRSEAPQSRKKNILQSLLEGTRLGGTR